MAQRRIGALTIGQSPRPDLVEPLAQILSNFNIIQAGALDNLTSDDLPDVKEVTYPLVTRMGDGNVVIVAENYIAPKLQQALDLVEKQDVAASLLMCAGTFAKLHGNRPLFKPFEVGKSVLHSLGFKSIGLIAPVPEQEAPIRHRWDAAGWKATVWSADISNQDQAFHQKLSWMIGKHNLECIVLDYFGHPINLVEQLQHSTNVPVLDLGYLSITILARTI